MKNNYSEAEIRSAVRCVVNEYRVLVEQEVEPRPPQPSAAPPVQAPKQPVDKSEIQKIDDHMTAQWWGMVKKFAPSFVKIRNMGSHQELTQADNAMVMNQYGQSTQKTLFDLAYEELKKVFDDMMWGYGDETRANASVHKERIEELYRLSVKELKDKQRRRLAAASYSFPADSAEIHDKFMKKMRSGRDASGKQSGMHEQTVRQILTKRSPK